MRLFLLSCVAAFALAAAGPARGDSVVTVSGQTYVGTVTEDTAERVAISTESGSVVIPRAAVASVEKGAAVAPQVIVPARVKPADAGKTFDEAKTAVAKGQWTRAGGLLEGLLELDRPAFPQEKRLAATAALVTCYLGVKDAKGAARTFIRRAELLSASTDKRRLLATADALEKAGSTTLACKTVATYEEAIAAAMSLKTKQLLTDAKAFGAKASNLNDKAKLEAASKRILEKLNEADLYSPGFSVTARKEALTPLADNIMRAARKAVADCTNERKVISRYWRTSAADAKNAVFWNERIMRYLGTRQAAEDGLKNLKEFGPSAGVPELAAERDKELTELLVKLEELQYHEVLPGMPEKLLIAPRRIGTQWSN